MYSLTDDRELVIQYDAWSDQDTIVNLTHHSYFNLGGSVLDHEIVLRARRFTPVDEDSIPTGELRDVSGTPFDFTEPTAIGARIDDDDDQLVSAGGYDHNWVLDIVQRPRLQRPSRGSHVPRPGGCWRCRRPSPASNSIPATRSLRTWSGSRVLVTARARAYAWRPSIFPDSPNKPHFPTVTLRAGERYRSTTVYLFATLPPSIPPSATW